MYKDKRIGVVVPAHNEENFIATVIHTVPDFVDKIYVVNDASTDKTRDIIVAEANQNNKIVAIHRKNKGGVGAAILSGHIRATEDGMDIMAVMAGDGQMDPEILSEIIGPVVESRADYVKGNRLSNSEHRKEMPAWRLFGNVILTNLTRMASGYWGISDPQDGYTAISADIFKKIDINKIERGFAFENDMLVKLNVAGARVVDVQHPAIYRGQDSKIHYSNFIFRTSWILFKDSVWRIKVKYFRLNNTKLEKKTGII